MKLYTVVGYAVDGAAYCCNCITPKEDDHPIFLENVINNETHCDICFESLDN